MNAIVYVALRNPEAQAMADYLQGLGYRIRLAHPDSQVPLQVAAIRPDLVVLDLAGSPPHLPAIIAELKEQGDTPILLVRRDDAAFPFVAVCLTAGADDLIAAGADLLEFQSRLTLLGRVGRDRKRVSERLVGLQSEVDYQRKMSTVDPLTELYNRRYPMQRLGQEVRRARRYRTDLSVILCDVDHFKRVNDTHGHDVGDEALRHVAGVLARSTRDTDVVARYGGEEFCIVLPNTPVDSGTILADRARQRLEDMPLILPGFSLRLTLSAGVAGLNDDDAVDATDLLKRADQALCDAKESGRNRVREHGRTPTPLGVLKLANG